MLLLSIHCCKNSKPNLLLLLNIFIIFLISQKIANKHIIRMILIFFFTFIFLHFSTLFYFWGFSISSFSNSITSRMPQFKDSQIRTSVSMLMFLPFPMLAIIFVVRPAAIRKSSFLILRSTSVCQRGL